MAFMITYITSQDTIENYTFGLKFRLHNTSGGFELSEEANQRDELLLCELANQRDELLLCGAVVRVAAGQVPGGGRE